MNEKDFALIIRKKRESLKLTQQQAAALCGVSDRTFQNVEYANISTVFSTYASIAKALGLKFILQDKKRRRATAKA